MTERKARAKALNARGAKVWRRRANADSYGMTNKKKK
jgi:hypothetical protein